MTARLTRETLNTMTEIRMDGNSFAEIYRFSKTQLKCCMRLLEYRLNMDCHVWDFGRFGLSKVSL